MGSYDDVPFETLKGKTLKSVNKIQFDSCYRPNQAILFKVTDNEIYKMYHDQDCCESVEIEDICGELEWLVDSPILIAEKRTNSDEIKEDEFTEYSFTWTFYEIATLKGSVTIRWYGSSNGYYSEEVNFQRIEECAL